LDGDGCDDCDGCDDGDGTERGASATFSGTDGSKWFAVLGLIL
jgi:hypothetical protein